MSIKRRQLYPAQELRRRVMAWAIKLKVNPKVVRIQEMRRKWGSCSSGGIITLAKDLVEKDSSFQDYIIAHELLHLRIPNHGKLFKTVLTAYVPKWRCMEISSKN